ncbi:MAG: THUMP domain-containing protein [Candidatus Bathyarchaeia archaeon]
MYDYNLLVSYGEGLYARARSEALTLLKELGDPKPRVRRTLARGLIGVKTALNPVEVVHGLRRLYGEKPDLFGFCLKWIPVERWTFSDIESMRAAVDQLREEIAASETWRMTVEKRRYSLLHRSEIVKELAELIDRKVDLENYDKELRVDILGRYAAISVLRRGDIFSLAAPYE